MVKPVRRIVTGHDAEGRSIFLEDGPAPSVFRPSHSPNVGLTNLWLVDALPADADGPDLTSQPFRLEPPATAMSCASSSFRPTRSATTAIRPRSSASMARRPSEARPMSVRTLQSNVRERRKVSRPVLTSRSCSRLRHRRRGRDLGADGRRRDPDEDGRRADPARHQPCVEQPLGQAGAGVFCAERGVGRAKLGP